MDDTNNTMNRIKVNISSKDVNLAMDLDISLKLSEDGSRLLADKVYAPAYLMLEVNDIFEPEPNDFGPTVDLSALNQIAELLNQNPNQGGSVKVPTSDGYREIDFESPNEGPQWTSPDSATYLNYYVGVEGVVTHSKTISDMLDKYTAISPLDGDSVIGVRSLSPAPDNNRGPVATLLKAIANDEKNRSRIESNATADIWPLVKERIDGIREIKQLGNIVSRFCKTDVGTFDDLLNELEGNSQCSDLNELLMTPFVAKEFVESSIKVEATPGISVFNQVPKQDVSFPIGREFDALLTSDIEGVALVRSDKTLIAFATPNEHSAEHLLIAPEDYKINATSLLRLDRPELGDDNDMDDFEPDIAPEAVDFTKPRR
jgi:hypothetical protein